MVPVTSLNLVVQILYRQVIDTVQQDLRPLDVSDRIALVGRIAIRIDDRYSGVFARILPLTKNLHLCVARKDKKLIAHARQTTDGNAIGLIQSNGRAVLRSHGYSAASHFRGKHGTIQDNEKS